MSRWRTKTCSEPEVHLHHGIPRCRNCKETASESLRDAKPISVNVSLSIPPDEPSGSLNLHWPPSIRWADTPTEHASSENQPTTAYHEVVSQRSETESHSITGGPERRYNVYPRPLLSNEIRLIRLGVEDASNAVMHLTLEVYDSEECPEYETVAYTWTGEDGDTDLSEPIFIDAICINQADVVERNSQVANMGNIYFQCSRVVVWLGHDLVQESATKYRRRRRIGEIGEEFGNASKLEEILRRRYFSRMWVIQEVVLAPSSIFPIGQADFFASVKSTNELPSILGDERWDSVRVGWLEHMHDPTRFRGLDLFEVLHLASPLGMDATDPRDLIFGVLGLLHDSPSGPLTPRYSVSAQNVLIGTMAHFLLDLRHDHLLRYALGREAVSPFPSWLPDWDTIWHCPANGALGSLDYFEANIYHDYDGFISSICASEHSYIPKCLIELSFGWLQAIVWLKDPKRTDTKMDLSNWHKPRYVAAQPAWLDDASIGRSNASLSIKVLHLMVLDSILELKATRLFSSEYVIDKNAHQTNFKRHYPSDSRTWSWNNYLLRRASGSLGISVDHPALETVDGNDGPTSLCIVKTC
ncbi:uncharacterized protein PG986_004472 [Apiospora aurea]|uniref:Heterokaryon incompatibility domain-containing protein n=1 Tax=Apiospora aurea TaxID=335848 RepID=A0ABR1QMX6_9PEZI